MRIAGLLAGRGTIRLAIGVGRIPRGEVTLVVAGIRRTSGAIGGATFAAVVLIVLVGLGCAIRGAVGVSSLTAATRRRRRRETSSPGAAAAATFTDGADDQCPRRYVFRAAARPRSQPGTA